MNKKLKLKRCVYAILTTMAINIAALGQDTPLKTAVTLNSHNNSIEKILKKISEEYKITFSYGNKNVILAKQVNVNVRNKPLNEVLDDLFDNSGIKYELVGEQIVLTKEYKKAPNAAKVVKPRSSKKTVAEKNVYVNKPLTKAQKMDTIILRAMDWHRIPGLSFGVVKDNKVLQSGTYGVTDKEKNIPISETTYFPMVWFSQTVAIVAIMQQVEKGKIKLDEKVTVYLPDFKFKDKKYKDITVRHLLAHTSGLKNQPINWNNKDTDPTKSKKLTKKKIKAPGEETRFNSINYVFLGQILEEVTGKNYEDYVQENIFDPMTMSNSSFKVDKKNKDNYVSQHLWWRKNQVNPEYPHSKSHLVSHGWQANTIDMAKWGIMLANDGKYKGRRIISSESLQEIWSNQASLTDFLKRDRVFAKGYYGFGWVVGEYRNRKAVVFSAGIQGIMISMIVCPEDNMAVFTMSNNYVPSNFPTLGVAFAALDIYNPNYTY